MNAPLLNPPWQKVGRHIESATRKALYDFSLIQNAPKIGMALSGGKDSITLLAMLKTISGRGFPPFELYGLHVSGEFSCGASISLSLVESICKQLKVPLIVRESTQRLETLECYSCSRERRTMLFEAAKSVGCHTIAFGHHRDDHAQTLMMNLFHKGEFAGLLPKLLMVEYDVTIIRPLIFVSEQDIITFAQQQGFRRMTCQCPVGQNSLRKKTDILLSDLEAVYPNARENLAQAGHLYGSDKARRP